MFSAAQVNGTMEKFSAVCVRLAKANIALIPFILFFLVTFITTIGPGNIATTALMAPMCMAIAGRIGLSPFRGKRRSVLSVRSDRYHFQRYYCSVGSPGRHSG